MTDTKPRTIPTEIEDLCPLMEAFEKKYRDLVWYARSRTREEMEAEGTPEEIITKALNAQSMKEELYPDEIDDLRSDTGDWSHGFNSGCLATMRWVITALAKHEFIDEESEDPEATYTVGGPREAELEFPWLDT